MRRYLDLNQPSMIFVKIIGVFMILIPAIAYGIALLLDESGIVRKLLVSILRLSFAVGASVLIIFLVLVVVEQIQDHYFNRLYQKQRNRKLLLANGYYECQYCGNQGVRENDKSCHVCGKVFDLVNGK